MKAELSTIVSLSLSIEEAQHLYDANYGERKRKGETAECQEVREGFCESLGRAVPSIVKPAPKPAEESKSNIKNRAFPDDADAAACADNGSGKSKIF